MKTLRSMLSVLAVSAAAALLGAACMSSDEPVNGDATDVGASVGSSQDALTRPASFLARMQHGGGGRGCAVLQDGSYCGGHNGVPGKAKTLYRCLRGKQSVIEVCPADCVWMSGGTPDYCV
jgi:hypothetical protein